MAWPMTSTIAAVLMSLVSVQLANAADVKCSNPPPGVRVLFRGVDVTSLDMMPLDNDAETGIRNPVIKFTCNKGKGWTSPDGGRYNDPDQTWAVHSTSSGSMTHKVRTIKTTNDVKKSLAVNAGIEGMIKGVAFSASASYKEMQHSVSQNDKTVNDVSSFESSSIMQLQPSYVLELDPNAQLFVDRFLKGKPFKTNKAVYMRFIKIFGTHYFREGKFGGIIRSYMETSTSILQKETTKDIAAAIEADFWGQLKIKGDVKVSNAQKSNSFTQNTDKKVKYYGGNVNLLKTGGLQDWQPTVDKDPYLISGKLVEISQVVKDDAVKADLKLAIDEYIYRTFVTELLKDVVAARLRERTDFLDKYKQKVETLLRKDIITAPEVNDLNAPEWFTSNTKLCYQWKSKDASNKAQCGGSTGRAFCAVPGVFTNPYLDQTGGNNPGCKMQWSLHSIDHAAWFNNVKLCFKYSPNGDWGQCGGSGLQPNKEMCAPVNTYTTEYFDKTNHRSGGCKMAWKIQVPSDAPFWMESIKLCVKYEPSNEGGKSQCNGGTRGTMCAEGNNYTPYYLDDTNDRQAGGCQLSWGLKVGL